MDIDLAYPEGLWLLLVVPVVVTIALWVWRRRLRATAAWAARGLWDRLFVGHKPWRQRFSVVLLGVATVGLVLAIAQPRWGLAEQQVERQGVDVVFVLDTSLSMAASDVTPSRLWVAQTLIRRLVRELPQHRVALVQAEGDGVVMAPLTVDSAVIGLLLDAAQPGSLPTPGTELAAALERARELFPRDGDKHRVMVLVSDGEDHGSELERATKDLVEAGVVTHAIGVGTLDGTPLALPDPGGSAPTVYKRDEDGQVVVSRLIETTLERIADETDGVYVRAGDVGTDVAPIVDRINAMESRSWGSETVTLLEERFQVPATLAAVALGLYLALPPFARGRSTTEER
ncbi:MAG: VWA domain-containing protein [Acidobacteriota bacterium]